MLLTCRTFLYFNKKENQESILLFLPVTSGAVLNCRGLMHSQIGWEAFSTLLPAAAMMMNMEAATAQCSKGVPVTSILPESILFLKPMANWVMVASRIYIPITALLIPMLIFLDSLSSRQLAFEIQ